MVCLESLQEWVQARKMVRRTSAATEGGLKLVHAFYIGMLGIRYRYGRGFRVLWPSQYTWLLNNGLVKWRDRDAWGLSEDLIRDKSKADGLVKLAALCQVTWFVLQCILRAANRYAIAPLEAMTLAYVFVVFLTYLFWWIKPKDISTTAFVVLPPMSHAHWRIFESLAMENTYDVEDPDAKFSPNIAWYLVSRDCRDDEVVVMGQDNADGDTESHGSSKEDAVATAKTDQTEAADRDCEKGGMPAAGESDANGNTQSRTNSNTEAVTRAKTNDTHSTKRSRLRAAAEDSMIITQWDEALYFSKLWPLICILGAAFGALHLMSWNSAFPTTVELWLWRASALLSVVTSIICMQFRTMSFRWDGPLTMIAVASPVLYVISRFVMLAEVFASLRAMPASTYSTFVLWNYWLHFL
jgi:hypothetical protein